MHIFLTGPIQIGKSTVIDRTLGALGGPVYGFRTSFGPDRYAPEHALYLYPAGHAPVRDEAHVVAQFYQGGPPQVFPERFDRLGTEYLTEACGRGGIIMMDECGRLERGARAFQRAVLLALEGELPILGVIGQGSRNWTAAIAAHASVQVLEVTAENRDALPGYLVKVLRQVVKTN